MAKKIEKKSDKRLLLYLILIIFYSGLLTVQNIVGIYLLIASVFVSLFYFTKNRFISEFIIVIYVISLFQIWNSDIYLTNSQAVGACLDICIGDDLMIWAIKLFSIVLFPISIIVFSRILKNGVQNDNSRT